MVNNNIASKLILGFLVLIVGISLISTIASNGLAVTEKTLVYNEALDIANARLNSGVCSMSINDTYPFIIVNPPTGWQASECAVTSFSMINQTDVLAVITTDYIFYGNNGSLYLKNTTKFNDCAITVNDTELSYTYCGDDYLNIAWGRAIINLISGFFALALLGVSAGIFYSVARDANILK